jgi:polyisoprenoid-binding protein YceI
MSSDFFNIEKDPEIKFKSESISQITPVSEDPSKKSFLLIGDLTIKGLTKKIILNVTLRGIKKIANLVKAQFSVVGIINRRDFNLTWSHSMDKGGLRIGEEVEILCEIEMLRAAEK